MDLKTTTTSKKRREPRDNSKSNPDFLYFPIRLGHYRQIVVVLGSLPRITAVIEFGRQIKEITGGARLNRLYLGGVRPENIKRKSKYKRNIDSKTKFYCCNFFLIFVKCYTYF